MLATPQLVDELTVLFHYFLAPFGSYSRVVSSHQFDFERILPDNWRILSSTRVIGSRCPKTNGEGNYSSRGVDCLVGFLLMDGEEREAKVVRVRGSEIESPR